MNDSILRALMQLFAIVANTDEVGLRGREIVERFLRRQLGSNLVAYYLEVYDNFLDKLKGKNEEGKIRKKTSVNSVKVLRICTEINKELDQKQKLIVLIRLFEFINITTESETEQNLEFLRTVSETFSINVSDHDNCYLLVKESLDFSEAEAGNFLVIDNKNTNDAAYRHLFRENINGRLTFLVTKDPELYIYSYTGNDQLYHDGRAVLPDSVYVFEPGSVIRGSKLNPVYYNDIIHTFSGHNVAYNISFDVQGLGYSFRGNKVALHELTFSSASKNLVGVMGNSGAGKTTTLNLLNGTLKPSKGKILINGIELYANKDQLRGLIGNIPQDDLLIEELTVFQNLFFSSKLYFGALSDEEITKRVDHCLQTLGLFEIKDLLVGDPLNKYISGGQRKRLNIALELIREPEILFVDEPTSGLSSNDAENVMDLLKHLALSGKLIFVVIHQPSSEIFKLFDQLLLLDTGGYPVYFGNPVDSLRYFKQQMNYVDYERSECAECGNINSEEIFKILEAKTVNEFGKPTSERKISSEEWFKLYNTHFVENDRSKATDSHKDGAGEVPKVSNRLVQFIVYFQRNFLAKMNNRQYLSLTFFEGPLLALILAIALRAKDAGKAYTFGANPNIPVYMFICTIVALFLGLIVSADEIIQDKKILKRESFLQLSRNSYLTSKITFLFLVSAVQSLLFLLVGNLILGFAGLFFDYWAVLFSVSCFGNLLGLNISSAMKTRVAVYILIPFLIIPQIMLSGVLVRFEDLGPLVSNEARVPFIGNIMASRWAYEGLVTDQFKNNKYEAAFFESDKRISNLKYRQGWWSDPMQEEIARAEKLVARAGTCTDSCEKVHHFLAHEFNEFKRAYPAANIVDIASIAPGTTKQAFIAASKQNIATAIKFVNEEMTKASEEAERKRAQQPGDDVKAKYCNEKLVDIALNKTSKNQVVVTCNSIVRHFEPVFVASQEKGLFCAQFYSYSKSLFGMQLETIWYNTIMIWLMTTGLYIALYFDVLKKLLSGKFKRLYFNKRKS